MFNIAHLSDLHFSVGAHQDTKHSHSISHLKGIEGKIINEELDKVIFSGDISDCGDPDSLLRAWQWIFESFPIGNGDRTGLNLEPSLVGIVPGNHDAWNATRHGKFIDRRQSSLKNYNSVFIEHQINEEGCYYDWVEKDGKGLYIAYADSSLLGDHKDTTQKVPGVSFFEDIAKGKFSIKQSECLLEWHDLGLLGRLPYPKNNDKFIEKSIFTHSLKILVMHHYIFEPFNQSSEYLLRLKAKDKVFRNIALSDFDLLLCGHKHFLSSNKHTYGHHFDKRATNRYVMNCFRRNMGIHSLPIQYSDDHGNRLTRNFSKMVNILIKGLKKSSSTHSDEYIDELINILHSGTSDPKGLKKKIDEYSKKYSTSGGEEITKEEINEIEKRITIGLDFDQRKILSTQANKILSSAKKLKNRTFLQNMSGSSAKSSSSNADRTICFYSLTPNEEGWCLDNRTYFWDWTKNAFQDTPQEGREIFYKMLIARVKYELTIAFTRRQEALRR